MPSYSARKASYSGPGSSPPGVLYQRNVGPQVSPVDHEKWADAMETLALLEGYATAEAAKHIKPEDVIRLRELNASMEEAIKALDVMAFSLLNRQFHHEIYRRCPNDYLQRISV